MDQKLKEGYLSQDYIRTAYVGPEEKEDTNSYGFGNWGYAPDLSEEDRNTQIIDAIRKILSVDQEREAAA